MSKFSVSREGRERIANGYTIWFSSFSDTEGYKLKIMVDDVHLATVISKEHIGVAEEAGRIYVRGKDGKLLSLKQVELGAVTEG